MNLLPGGRPANLHCFFRRMLDTLNGGISYRVASQHHGSRSHGALPGMFEMPTLPAFLRSTRYRIGRHLSQIAAIAAASLPAVGA
jgi:hypothetical protein